MHQSMTSERRNVEKVEYMRKLRKGTENIFSKL